MRRCVIVGLFILGASPAGAQKLPNSNPFTAMQLQLAKPPALRQIPPVSAQRTVEILRAAGIVPATIDRPFSLSSRVTLIDPNTFLTMARAGMRPERNAIYMDGRDTPTGGSALSLNWNADPERRYVVDCAIPAGVGAIEFAWGTLSFGEPAPGSFEQVPILNGRAAVVLPAGAGSMVQIHSEHAVELTNCDVTPFGA